MHMSMVARFVQITPVVLQHYVSDPSEVDEVFDAVEAPAQKMAGRQFATSDAMKRAAESTPQMLTATLERMDPKLRQQLEKRLAALGVDIEALQAGRGGEQLVKRMQQRVGALMATARGGHAVSGRRAGPGAAAA